MIGDEEKVEQVVNVAAGIIVKQGENGEDMVLLIQRSSEDHWPLHFEFPRGKCDKGDKDAPSECAIREIKEETGLDVEIVEYLGRFIYYAMAGKRKSICYNYECRMKNPNQKVKLSNEHEAYKWITQVGEAELLVHPDQKKYIQQVLSRQNQIVSTPDNGFTQNNSIEENTMKKLDSYLGSLFKEEKEPCWKGYEMVGFKMKNGKKVPNCVPVKEEDEKKDKPLNKPFRMPSGSKKKFGVYVKNDKGNVVKVTFGDPNMEIKRDDPERLKAFRARHGCDNPGPKWKAKYWSCKFWEKGISVTKLLDSEDLQELHPMHERNRIRKRIKGLNVKKKKCASAKNPTQCRVRYDTQIAVLRKRLEKLSNLRI